MTDSRVILYYAPGACSLANHIALIDAALPYELVRVDRDKRTEDGRDFLTINPKGYIPALALPDGAVLTENLAILCYIAERTGKLAAKEGLDRWRTLEALAFMTTELHGNFKPLFYPDTSEAVKEKALQALARRFGTISQQLGNRDFLIGNDKTIADAYLCVMLMWAEKFALPLDESLQRYLVRAKGTESVARALSEEGLA